jgi:hypothetical protein
VATVVDDALEIDAPLVATVRLPFRAHCLFAFAVVAHVLKSFVVSSVRELIGLLRCSCVLRFALRGLMQLALASAEKAMSPSNASSYVSTANCDRAIDFKSDLSLTTLFCFVLFFFAHFVIVNCVWARSKPMRLAGATTLLK